MSSNETPMRYAASCLGYDPIGGGGISNQKMALIGLLLEGFETGRPVVLPRFRVMDQLTRTHRPLAFDDVYEVEPILAFCRRHDVMVETRDPSELPHGYDAFFWKTYAVLYHMPAQPFSRQSVFVADLLRSMRPRIGSTFIAYSLRRTLEELDPDYVVAQIRIEQDWKQHCDDNLKNTAPPDEQNYLPFNVIVGRIASSLKSVRTLYITCDEPAMPLSKMEMKAVAAAHFGIDVRFKSDYISPFEQGLLNELHLSLLDFEIATHATRFVGISRSTFSCLATLEKHCREMEYVKQHYIYNAPLPALGERTDNGCYWDAREVTIERDMGWRVGTIDEAA
jgi:hypothetical protein